MSTQEKNERYLLESKEVSKEEYEAFKAELGDLKFWSCAKQAGGGKSTSRGVHKTTKKEYEVIDTAKFEKRKHEIKLVESWK